MWTGKPPPSLAISKSANMRVKTNAGCAWFSIIPRPGQYLHPAYERMVSLAASLTWRLSQQNVFLSFVSQEYGSVGDSYGFLQHLATATPQPGASVLESLAGSTDYSLVFTACRRGTIPASLWANCYFLFAE